MSELSTIPTNVAIPTMRMCDATERQGNCMRHSQIAHQAAARQCPGTVNAVAANNLLKPHRHGLLGSHTRAQDAVFTGMRHTRPTTTAPFPRQQADKSLHNHHVLSILIVGPNQLKHRLSRTSKPKSHPASNTFCPSSSLVPTNLNTDFPASISRKVTPPVTRSVL